MQNFSIQWSKADVSDLSNERYLHLFLFERNGRILFIGNPQGKDFQTLIPGVEEVIAKSGRTSNLWIGRIIRSVSDKVKIETTEQLRKMLLFSERPLLNGKENYLFKSEEKYTLTNFGLNALPSTLRYEHGKLIRSKKSTSSPGLRITATR